MPHYDFNADRAIRGIKSSQFYENQIVFETELSESSSKTTGLSVELPKVIRDSLRKQSIERLFSHQRNAIVEILKGRNCVISTPAASGKSECYNIPIFNSLTRNPSGCALYLFPMNALMRDQLRKIMRFDEKWTPGHEVDIDRWLSKIKLGISEIWYGRYIFEKYHSGLHDEETVKTEARREIRDKCNILFTNADMLHTGILPHHHLWKRFFRNLEYIVIDEIHSYKGAWGSHFANVLRRLRRICAYYGSAPSYICTSATIGNPEELTQKIVGGHAESISKNGAPISRKKVIFWKPKRGAVNEVSNLVCHLIKRGCRTIVFGKSQNICKLISRRVRQNPAGRKTFRYYGADLPDDERREIESDLKEGGILGIASTSAMELGIDIGDLSVCILVGYPGSVASFWQRAGRVGRTGQGIIIMVGVNDPIVQYIMRHPRELLSKPVEQIVLNPDNERVLKAHIWQAHREVPISQKDAKIFGKEVKRYLEELVELQSMKHKPENDEDEWYWELTHSQHPPEKINIRNPLSKYQFDIIDERGNAIGRIDNHSALRKLHPRAVYVKDDADYLVADLSFHKRIAWVRATPRKLDYYTYPLIKYEENVRTVIERKTVGRTNICFGRVRVTEAVLKYKERKFDFDEKSLIKQRPKLIPWRRVPKEVIETTAFWFTVPAEVLVAVPDQDNVPGGLHAIEHAMIPLLAYRCSCDREEIGGLSTDYHEDTDQATIFIHDANPGGYGYARKGYEIFPDLLDMTLNQINKCKCRTENGCPNCIQDVHCGNNNEPLNKKAAAQIIEHLMSD